MEVGSSESEGWRESLANGVEVEAGSRAERLLTGGEREQGLGSDVIMSGSESVAPSQLPASPNLSPRLSFGFQFPGGNDNYLTITGPSHPFLSGAEVSTSCRRCGGEGVRQRRGRVVGRRARTPGAGCWERGPRLMLGEKWQLPPQAMRTMEMAREAAVIRKVGRWKRPNLFQTDLDWNTEWNCLLSWRRNNYNNLGRSQRGEIV